jgi:hypothetical protein
MQQQVTPQTLWSSPWSTNVDELTDLNDNGGSVNIYNSGESNTRIGNT